MKTFLARSLATCALLMLPLVAVAQVESARQMLQDQVDAYNRGDVERLVANVSEGFKWFSIASDSLLLEVAGKDDFRKGMESYFEGRTPPHSKIDGYVIDGNRISFREIVSHENADGETVQSSAMGVYEFRDGKIHRGWYFID
jgi:hypothetical protein